MKYILREYQQQAVDSVFDYWIEGKGKHPILCLPTASGKSIIQAAIVRQVLKINDKTRMMCISHVKELLEQNAEKLKSMMPRLDVGVYSAGLKQKQTDSQVIVAGIQSCYKNAHDFGDIKIIFIDECHLLSPTKTTRYQRFLEDLRRFVPRCKVIGLTATPFRTGSGLLTDGKNALFDGFCYDVDMNDLIKQGYLSPLTTISTKEQADTSGIKIRAGDFAQNELEKRMNNDELTDAALSETMNYCADRKSWIVFCCGVKHALSVRDKIRKHNINCETITGKTPPNERENILNRLKSGRLRAVTNANVLTTGFDAPNIDLIVMLRPTASPGLYVQSLGRGMRVHPGKKDCLVLDFTDNILRHGPVDKIRIKKKLTDDGYKNEVDTKPMRKCPGCNGLVFISASECPDCGHQFKTEERKLKHKAKPIGAPIMSKQIDTTPKWLKVYSMEKREHTKKGKPPSLRIDYIVGQEKELLSVNTISHWVCLEHGGFAKKQAKNWWSRYVGTEVPKTVDEALISKIPKPTHILVKYDGKYSRIIDMAYSINGDQ